MGSKILKSLMSVVLVIGLMPTLAMADDATTGDGVSTPKAGDVVQSGSVLVGATGSIDAEDRAPKFNDVTYKITLNDDLQTYTLTFDGNGEIPTYKTESQGTATDGTEGKATPAWTAKQNGELDYPNGYVTDADGQKHALPTQKEDAYLYCTNNTAYYNAVPWSQNAGCQYTNNITKVIFGDGVTKVGMYTLFNFSGLKSVQVNNPDCKIDNNAIYFNGKSGSSIAIDVASTVTANINSIAGANTNGNFTAGDVVVNIADAIAFEEKASAAIADMPANALTEEQKTEIKGYYSTYEAGNDRFKNALSDNFVKQLTTLNLAANGKMEGDAIIAKEGAVQNGVDSCGTIHYQLLTEDGGDTYTLRFYESDTVNGNGKMSDFVVKDTSGYDDYDRYQNAPWYSSTYRLKIKKVVYDKSITRTGALTACHLYNCEEFVFENPNVVLASTTIHWNDQIQAASVKIKQYASANMEKEGGNVYWAKTQGGVNADLSMRVSFVYEEAEQYKATYANLFAKDASNTTKDEVSAAKSAFNSLANVCRAQLSRDRIPDGTMSYLEKLNAVARVHGLGESDENAVVKSGVVPSNKGDAETVKYEISTADNMAYTVRFYESDPNGDGRFPDYSTGNIESWTNPELGNYGKLPWRTSPYGSNIVKMVFDSSIKYVGQYVAANMPSCTDFVFNGSDVSMHKNAIYFNYGKDAANGTGQVYIHAYSTANPTYNYNSSEGRFNSNGTDKDRIHFSYIEAEQFETNPGYATLWVLNAADALEQSGEIEAAYAAYGNLPDKAKEQLNADTIANSDKTYFGKLSELMAAVGKGGSCGDGAQYVISDNGATLTISGTGAVSSSPWTAYKSTISKVVLSSGIEGVDDGIFAELTSLKSVDVAQTVTTIADHAFPDVDFTMYGWMNHASGKYCDSHSNVSLKLKELRILCMGNSHTADYTEWLSNVIKDMSDAGMNTKITYQRLYPMGGRGLYEEQGDRSSHYVAAHSADDAVSKPYKEAFAKTWDVVIAQDYHESTMLNKAYGGTGYVEDMKKVVRWLHESASGAKIVWFADWADKSANGADKLDQTYKQSIAAVREIAKLGAENGPDHIIAAATVLQNARTSFLGTTMNPSDVLLNNKKADGTYVFGDCAKDNMGDYTVLERDATHMSLELGRQLMATNFAYDMCNWLGNKLDTTADFDMLNSVKTAPEYKSGDVYWQGEFTPEIWSIVKESCRSAALYPYNVSQSQYVKDSFADKWAQVKAIVNNAIPSGSTDVDAVTAAVKADEIVNAIKAIDGFSTVTADDITVAYTAPADGTTENGGAGINGKIEVSVNCHYGYSFPTEPAYSKTIPAGTTLQYKIDNAADGATISLDADTVEAITIPEGKTITLNLNGHKLVNAAEPQDKAVSGNLRHHTITNNGTLAIVDSVGGGIVDNVSHGCGALWNNAGATVTVSGGTFMRSAESSKNWDDNGGNSWYTIKNYGNMTINGENVKVMSSANNVGSFSSLIANGWYDASKAGINEPALGKDDTTLTIIAGAFDGGLNTVKNDTYGHLYIQGGTFTNQVQAAIMNWNTASITGGSFTVADGAEAVLLNGATSDKTANSGDLKITGGTFTASADATLIARASANYSFGSAEVAGGTFNGSFEGDLPTGENGLTVKDGTFSDQTFDVYCEANKGPKENTAAGSAGTTYTVGDLTQPSEPDATVDVLGKYKGTKAQADWTVPEGSEGMVFAGWYQDADLRIPCNLTQLNGVAYAKFVKALTDSSDESHDGVINFLGGALRLNVVDNYNKAELRFGYHFQAPSGVRSVEWGWTYGASADSLIYSCAGTNKRDLPNEHDAVIDPSWIGVNSTGFISNLVLEGVPVAHYADSLFVRPWVSYVTADGTSVKLSGKVSSRTVKGVAEAIVSSSSETEIAKGYAQKILDAYAANRSSNE